MHRLPMSLICISLSFCLLLTALVSSPLHAQSGNVLARSTFDNDADGWTTVGDAVGAPTPTFVPTGGNPGGYISGTDSRQSGRWYWSAPAKFRGNVSSAYGHVLSFDLRQNQSDNQTSYHDIVLTGAGLTLVYDTASNPGTTWTSYNIPLRAESGWMVRTTNQAASEADIRRVLGDLGSLLIRGEYRSGPDSGDLDNVTLGGSGVELTHAVYLPLVTQ
jgi:hypothetical protein